MLHHSQFSQARVILALELRGYFIGEDGTEPDTANVAAKPVKSQKTAQKAAKVEPILPETVTLSEQLEEYEELSDPEIGEGQEISCQNVCKGISQAPEILAFELRGYFIGEDGTKTELAVTEPTIEESRSNTGSFSITSTASSKYSTCQMRVLPLFLLSPPTWATR